MKKLLLVLTVLAFTNLSFAQALTVKDAAKATETVNKASSKEVQKQLENGLVNNDELAALGADYLKNNSETRSTFATLYKENKGVINSTMKSVMSNPKLKNSVMDWINNNPDVMNKALTMLGM